MKQKIIRLSRQQVKDFLFKLEQKFNIEISDIE